MFRRLASSTSIGLIVPSTQFLRSPAVTSQRWSSFAATAALSTEEQLAQLRTQLCEMEQASETNALLRFYGQRKHEKLNIPEVVRRSLDPNYNTSVYCHKQLPLLLAHNVRVLDTLPTGLGAMPSIMKVRRQYASSFMRLVNCPLPVDSESKKIFLDTVASIMREHGELNVLQLMALGVLELKEHLSRHTKARMTETDSEKQRVWLYRKILPEMRSIQTPLDEANRHMIHFNFLAGQLAGLEVAHKDNTRVGMVDRDLDLEKCVRFAVDDAKLICSNHYGDCPEVRFEVRWEGGDEPLRISHLGGTTTYIVTELMKNALRATVDAHATRNALGFVTCDEGVPPVRVLIHGKRGCRHATVCITDEGRGIARSHMDLVMSYTFTTAPKPVMEKTDEDAEEETSPLAGYGYGLPMSRQYARCFGGDLVLQSQEGFGTAAYLYLRMDDE